MKTPNKSYNEGFTEGYEACERIINRILDNNLITERARCQELVEDVADLVEDLNFYVSCTACEDNSPIRDEILEKLKPFLKETK